VRKGARSPLLKRRSCCRLLLPVVDMAAWAEADGRRECAGRTPVGVLLISRRQRTCAVDDAQV